MFDRGTGAVQDLPCLPEIREVASIFGGNTAPHRVITGRLSGLLVVVIHGNDLAYPIRNQEQQQDVIRFLPTESCRHTDISGSIHITIFNYKAT